MDTTTRTASGIQEAQSRSGPTIWRRGRTRNRTHFPSSGGRRSRETPPIPWATGLSSSSGSTMPAGASFSVPPRGETSVSSFAAPTGPRWSKGTSSLPAPTLCSPSTGDAHGHPRGLPQRRQPGAARVVAERQAAGDLCAGLVSSLAAHEADRFAEVSLGYSPLLLMEEAGIRLEDTLEDWRARKIVPSGPTVYLAGPGNNGGDALVMARQAHLRGRSGVTVVLVHPPSSESCRWQAALVRRLGIPLFDGVEAAAPALTDAAPLGGRRVGYGAGVGAPSGRGEVLAGLEALRSRLGVPSVAIDVPSGLWEGFAAGEPVLSARGTLAPGWLKDFCFHPQARDTVGTPVEVTLAFPGRPRRRPNWSRPRICRSAAPEPSRRPQGKAGPRRGGRRGPRE